MNKPDLVETPKSKFTSAIWHQGAMIVIGAAMIICLQIASTRIQAHLLNGRISVPNPLGELSLALRIFFGVLVAPLLETIIFQWIPINLVTKLRLPSMVAIAISAALFGVAHGLWNRWIINFVLTGAVLATVYVLANRFAYGRGLSTTLIAHAAFNGFVLFADVTGF